MSRELRTKLPVTENQLKKRYNKNEDDIENVNKNKKLQAYYHNKQATDYKALEASDTVRKQPVKLGEKTWCIGEVIKQVGPRSYMVQS